VGLLPKEKLRYLMVVPETSYFANLITDNPTRPGLYQWYKAFRRTGDEGEVKTMTMLAPNAFDDYNVIHVNLSGDAQEIVPAIKKLMRSTSTKLVLNLDYSVDNFQPAFLTPSKFISAIWLADFVFAVEPTQQALLQYLFSRMKDLASPGVVIREKLVVPLIPHPCSTEDTKKFAMPRGERLEVIAVQYHRYSKHYFVPAMIVRNIMHAKVPMPIPTMMLGCTDPTMATGLFDMQHSYTEWEGFMYMLSHCDYALTFSTVSSHSRFAEECACVEIPCVGSMNQYMVQELFPRIAHNLYDFEGMRQSLERLTKDEEFYKEVTAYASERVELYGWEKSKQRLLEGMKTWGITF